MARGTSPGVTGLDRFFLATYGCTLNESDSQVITAAMERLGWGKSPGIDEASLAIVNTCGVKVPTEQKIMYAIRAIAKAHPGIPVIVAGCLPVMYKNQIDRFFSIAPSIAALVGPRNYHELGELIDRVQAGQRRLVHLDGASIAPKSCMGQAREHPVVAILPIAEGCTGGCHYCCTRFARGPLQCYPATAIAGRLDGYIKSGVKETWITAEDCSAYEDPVTRANLFQLLESLLRINGGTMFRIGMMNPRTLLPFHEDLARLMANNDRLFKFIHVPVQSGSDTILGAMNRGYTRATFLHVIDTFKQAVPSICIATDVICGYPGETREDFEDTVSLVEQCEPDILNISAYGHRPGTVASRLPALPGDAVKERTRRLANLHHGITAARNARRVGWRGPVLIDEFNQDKNTWSGRDPCYRPVVMQGWQGVAGTRLVVEIIEARRHYLFGRVIP